MFWELQQSSLQVDVITYSAAISACEKGQQLQQALHLFGVLQQSILEVNVAVSWTFSESARCACNHFGVAGLC